MPLPFDSLSHGTVAFGFFDIDSDMLLLEECFLFATEFCEYISKTADFPSHRGLRTSNRNRMASRTGAFWRP